MPLPRERAARGRPAHQHETLPAVVSAQAYVPAAATAATPLVRPGTSCGAFASVVVPSPSEPL